MKRAVILAITLLAGCDLYWGHDDPPPDGGICEGYGGTVGAVPANELRDPTTGACNSYGGGGGGCTYDSNGCCTYPPYNGTTPGTVDAGVVTGGGASSDGGAASGIALPAESTCLGACEGLDENTCAATAGCHAEYQEEMIAYPDVADRNGNQVGFVQCWDIQPLAPLEGGDCTQLDAYTCAQHDDCVSIMTGVYDASGNTSFQECAAESSTSDVCANIDCGPGEQCEQQCYPCDPSYPGDTGCMNACSAVCVPTKSCDSLDCAPGSTCGVTCSNNSCIESCIPNGSGDPGSCTGNVECGSAPPACPANTVAGITNGCWSGYCIPDSKCTPQDPGSCDGKVTCNIAGPACPVGTVPGVENGCWSGYCIPQSSCPVKACETLSSESSCEARADCTPVYTGTNCTCTPDGNCTCESESFARCETIVNGL